MMKSVSSFTVIVTFVCLALVGLAVLPMLPVKLNPSRSLPGFSVYFNMPGTSARVVEMEVTSKLESMLARIRGVQQVHSVSGNGFGRISVDLDKQVDVQMVRFEASTVIRQTWSQLPDGVSFPVIQMKTPSEHALQPFMSYTLNAPSAPILIQQYAEEHIKPQLAKIPGIYKIELSGATPMEWRLVYDSEQLRTLGVTVGNIRDAVNRYYRRDFLGTHLVDEGQSGKRWLRLALLSDRVDQEFNPALIPVVAANGKMLRLDELVSVVRTEEEPQSYFRINGLNSIYLSITAEETANQLQLNKAVRQEMDRICASLPVGYEVHVSYDATEFIRDELQKIYFRTGLTVLILLMFVWFVTRRFKYLVLIVTSLLVNIAVAFIFYYLFQLEMQLYSLAGITISLNLVIDSTIVMADHLLHRRNLKAFLSVLAATLTTVGALGVIFFLDDHLRLNLQDFAAVVMLNLAVSLLVSLFFVPSMMHQLALTAAPTGRKRLFFRRRIWRRLPVYFSRLYVILISFLMRWRKTACLVLVLAFGLPVFLLPDKLEGEGRWATLYNQTVGSSFYQESVKPVVDVALGGSLRLFVQKVYEGSYFTRNEEVVLYANANLPNGSTLEQMNNLMKKMETYLSEFPEIRQFHTSIYSPRRASLQIYFKKDSQHSGFPYLLKSQMITKAIEIGGGDWSIYGLQDQGFNNSVRESAGSFRIKMVGYNYDELLSWAEKLKEKLLSYRRIKEVQITSEFSWWKDDYQEFYYRLQKESMAQASVDAQSLFDAVRPIFGRDLEVAAIATEQGMERIRLSSKQSAERDVWAMQYFPYGGANSSYKLSGLATLEKGQMPQEVAKENQQYRLCLQYEYIGSSEMGRKLQQQNLEEFNKLLPMGYKAESDQNYWGWSSDDYSQYALLVLIIAIIFFITSILFNSLKQPLAIIFVIPVSYVGVFLTFYSFQLNFDQGGFASFVLLCGLTVNASIYILNEYNSIRRNHPHILPLRAYIKAWNAKIIPIALTILSTVLGFIPFMVGTEKEAFWFPLAVGTIGGLVMSLVGIFFYLPLWVLNKKSVYHS